MGLDEKMDEALGKLDGINDALRKKSSKEKAKESISNTFEENEIDASDIDFFRLAWKRRTRRVLEKRRFTRFGTEVVSLRGLTEKKRQAIYDGVKKELSPRCAAWIDART